jgi:hypothetical protein
LASPGAIFVEMSVGLISKILALGKPQLMPIHAFRCPPPDFIIGEWH